MSANAYKAQYRRYPVGGSSAYDYDYVRGVEHSPSRGVERRAEETPRIAPVERIHPLNVLCVIVVMALLVVMINSYVMLSKSTTETVTLRGEISKLREEEMVLRAQQTVDLKSIENYATQELGMVSLNSDKVVYLDVSGEDNAVVAKSGTSTMNTKGLFAKIVEYFR